jgi:thiol-disulfide isomerase/thioredoxin
VRTSRSLEREHDYTVYSRVRLITVVVGTVLSGLLAIASPKTAEAVPAFSRQTGEPCSTCHDVIPKLNQLGQNFRINGFRFSERNEQKAAPDPKPAPHSPDMGSAAGAETDAGHADDPGAIILEKHQSGHPEHRPSELGR